MATTLPVDVQTRISCNVAETFIDTYYTALRAARHTISTFYTAADADADADGKRVPCIAWNGNVYGSGAAFQEAYVADMPAYTAFDVQSLDAHVLNPHAPAVGCDGGGGDGDASKLVGSVLVHVNGLVRLDDRDALRRAFSETLVLVPNRQYSRKKDGSRRWVVQNQNFRYVV